MSSQAKRKPLLMRPRKPRRAKLPQACETGVIRLSKRDSETILRLLENSPQPNAALRKAFERASTLLSWPQSLLLANGYAISRSPSKSEPF